MKDWYALQTGSVIVLLAVMICHTVLFCGSCRSFHEASEPGFLYLGKSSPKRLHDSRIQCPQMEAMHLQKKLNCYYSLLHLTFLSSGLERMPIQRKLASML